MSEFASRTTRFVGVDTHILDSGNTIKIHGIVAENRDAAARTIEFRHTGVTTIYFSLRLLTDTSIIVDISWIAEDGLDVEIDDADVIVTVFHSSPI